MNDNLSSTVSLQSACGSMPFGVLCNLKSLRIWLERLDSLSVIRACVQREKSNTC